MTVAMTGTTTIDQDTHVSFLWLEITGKCQLACEHCYADSGPTGSLTSADWMRVIDEAAELGVEMVQFIGGEPTLHPDFDGLVRHALSRSLDVEVYTGMRDGQHVDEACSQLAELGVTDIKVDHLRQIGRDVRDRSAAVDQLCGNCASGVLAVSPDGDVWPCVFARWMAVGNVRGGSQSTSSVACNPHHDCPPCIPKNCNPGLFMKHWSVAPVAPMRYELGVEK